MRAYRERDGLFAIINKKHLVSEPQMSKVPVPVSSSAKANIPSDLVQDAWAYWIDAWQRGVLMLDVLQQRGERYREHAAKAAPHVLKFGCELVMDGRKLPRPVNYVLVRIVPPEGVEIDENKRPFVIVDPRAGHGPGIGGFKPESEIGVAFTRRSSVLLHRLPARACARADDRGHRARGGGISRARDRASSGSRGQARRHRQLPGRVGGHAACSHEARAFRADHRRRLAALLLGRRARREPHALHRRPARRQLADRPDGRPRQRQVRRRLARQQLREPQPSQHLLDQALQPLLQDRHARRRAISSSSSGGAAMSLLNAEEMQFIVDELFVGNKLATGGDRHVRRLAHRSAQHPLADRRLLLEGGQHHAAAAGAWTGSSISTTASTTSGRMARPSSTPSTS